MILVVVLALFIISIPGLLFSEAPGDLVSSAVSVIFMIAYTKWFAPEFKGVLKTSQLATGLVIIWIPFLLKTIGGYIGNLIDFGFYFKPTFAAFAMAVAAGFYEETIFRGVTVPIGMRYIKSEKRVGIIVGLTALAFGLMHIGNIVNGASPTMAVIQGISSVFTGLLFVAVYLRTGNILIPIIMHGIFDYMCFTTDASLDSGIMTAETVTTSLMIAIAIDIISGLWGLYLIRPAKRAEIHAIWNDKWSVSESGYR